MKRPVLFFFLLILCASNSLRAQSFSLITGREPVASLDGLWRFHTGDNPAWASPNFDDSQWPLLRSDESWAKQGYKGYSGYAWYRFTVQLPAGLDHLSLLLPPLRTSYQVFVDGKQVGSFGQMLPPTALHVGAAVHHSREAEFPLNLNGPPEPRKITVALRVWHWPGWSRYYGGGPENGDSLAGESSLIHAHFHHLKDSRLLSSGGDYSMGLLCFIAGIMGLVLFLVRRKETEYFWFALNQFADSMTLGVTIYMHVYAVPLIGSDVLHAVLLLISSLSYMLLLQTLLRGRRSMLFYLAGAAIITPFLLFMSLLFQSWFSVGVVDLARAVCLLVVLVWVGDLLVRRAKEGLQDARLLLAPVLISAVWDPVWWALWAFFQLGWLTVSYRNSTLFSHPFPVSIADVVEALFLLAMLAILSNRFMRSRREEQRLVGELEAARGMQSLLVPATAPSTPGFTVESVYIPASEVGGDFFQILPGDDGSLLVVVGDVSGKGLKAAMTVSTIVGALRGCTARKPSDVLAYLNRVLHGQIKGFVTCCAALIAADGAATLANAGHLPPYLNGREMPMEGALPLGMMEGAEFSIMNFQLAPGDRLMLMSDGVAEAQDEQGQLFGFERIQKLVGNPITAAEVATAAQKFGQEDDISVLAVRRAANLNADVA
jgi:hypothetical protein